MMKNLKETKELGYHVWNRPTYKQTSMLKKIEDHKTSIKTIIKHLKAIENDVFVKELILMLNEDIEDAEKLGKQLSGKVNVGIEEMTTVEELKQRWHSGRQ